MTDEQPCVRVGLGGEWCGTHDSDFVWGHGDECTACWTPEEGLDPHHTENNLSKISPGDVPLDELPRCAFHAADCACGQCMSAIDFSVSEYLDHAVEAQYRDAKARGTLVTLTTKRPDPPEREILLDLIHDFDVWIEEANSNLPLLIAVFEEAERRFKELEEPKS